MQQTATIDSTGTKYTGSADFTYYDTTGKPISGEAGTFKITATKDSGVAAGFVVAPTPVRA